MTYFWKNSIGICKHTMYKQRCW